MIQSLVAVKRPKGELLHQWPWGLASYMTSCAATTGLGDGKGVHKPVSDISQIECPNVISDDQVPAFNTFWAKTIPLEEKESTNFIYFVSLDLGYSTVIISG